MYTSTINLKQHEKTALSAALFCTVLSFAQIGGINAEALLLYQKSTSSFNVISGKGNPNNYPQLNIRNQNSGSGASCDIVAAADNGNETTKYKDMGINSSTYSPAGFSIAGVNDACLYSAGNDFAIGNSTEARKELDAIKQQVIKKSML